MTSSEQPEADALDQRREVFDDPFEDPADLADELSPRILGEADPADAIEQYLPAGSPDDDEDYPSG